MLESLQRHIVVWIKSRTGLSSGFLISRAVTGVAAVMMFVFLCVAGYAWLSVELGPVLGGLAMAGAFLLIAVIGAASSALAQRQTKKRALVERATRARGPMSLLDPAILNVLMRVGRGLGWERIVPVALLAFLATQWAQEARHRQARVEGPGRQILDA
jgi:hypothetical protein